MSLDSSKETFQHKGLKSTVKANAQQNTWYSVLDFTLDARVLWLWIQMDTAVEDLELRLTIDGKILVGAQAQAVIGTIYYAYIGRFSDSLQITANATPLGFYGAWEGKSIKVEMRKTSAAGAGTLLGGIVYAQK